MNTKDDLNNICMYSPICECTLYTFIYISHDTYHTKILIYKTGSDDFTRKKNKINLFLLFVSMCYRRI